MQTLTGWLLVHTQANTNNVFGNRNEKKTQVIKEKQKQCAITLVRRAVSLGFWLFAGSLTVVIVFCLVFVFVLYLFLFCIYFCFLFWLSFSQQHSVELVLRYVFLLNWCRRAAVVVIIVVAAVVVVTISKLYFVIILLQSCLKLVCCCFYFFNDLFKS